MNTKTAEALAVSLEQMIAAKFRVVDEALPTDCTEVLRLAAARLRAAEGLAGAVKAYIAARESYAERSSNKNFDSVSFAADALGAALAEWEKTK